MSEKGTVPAEIEDVDPKADLCPWCGETRRWKGRHADAKHPEKWKAFKTHYDKSFSTSVSWEEP